MPRYVDPGSSIFYYLVAIVLPPIAVGMIEGWSKQVLINLACWILGGIPGIIHACHIISRRTLHHPSAYEDLEACPHGDLPQPHAHGYEWVRVPVCYVAPHRPTVNCSCGQAHEMTHAPYHPPQRIRPACNTRFTGAGVASTHPRPRQEENQSIKEFVPASPSESDAPLLQDEELYDAPVLNFQAPAYEPPTPLGRDEMKKLKEDMQDKKSF